MDINPSALENEEDTIPKKPNQILATNLIRTKTLRKKRTLIDPVLEIKKDRELEKEANSPSRINPVRSNLEVHEWLINKSEDKVRSSLQLNT